MTDECIWTPDEPGGEFFFITGCGEAGVNKEDSYKFCPYCGKPMHIELSDNGRGEP